ncbi:MAG: hypothetical protein HQK49_19315 [Oligoflexia bacterium]|nr:hypothetical protein [Oligoflexia bacterium]
MQPTLQDTDKIKKPTESKFSLLALLTMLIMFLMFLLSIIIVSCAYGPKQEKKSPLNYLNGEHYQSRVAVPVPIAGVPVPIPVVVERIEKNTVINGNVFLRNSDQFGDSDYPIRFQKILLQKDSVTLAETTTNNDGAFSFSTPLANGTYTLVMANEKYTIEKKINVNIQSYSSEKVEMIARKR